MKSILLITLIAMHAVAVGQDLFSFSDMDGDDNGAGAVLYPANHYVETGDLDVTVFSGSVTSSGFWLSVEMAKRIKNPEGFYDPVSGEPLEKFFRHGFFNFNIDIYVKSRALSGDLSREHFTHSLFGRRVVFSKEEAWEKGIILTPRPRMARKYAIENVRQRLLYTAREAGVNINYQLRNRLEQEARGIIKKYLFYPEKIRVSNRKVRFFVPFEFIDVLPDNKNAYHLFSTAANLNPKMAILLSGKQPLHFVLSGKPGRPLDNVGFELDSDEYQPPVFDYLGSADQQQSVLSDYLQGGNYSRLFTMASTLSDMNESGEPSGNMFEHGTSDSPVFGNDKKSLSVAERLKRLLSLKQQSLITEQEYIALRKKIISEL